MFENLKPNWKDPNDALILAQINEKMVKLFDLYAEIMILLPDVASYDDFNYFFARDLVAQDGDIPVQAEKIDYNLLKLLNSFEKKEATALQLVKTSSDDSKLKFESLKFYWYLGAALIFGAIFFAIFRTRSIIKPVR